MARWVLLALCVAFVAFVAFQVRPGRAARARRGASRLRDARARAASAGSPAERARALAEAAALASGAGRWTSAAGLFLRAMRADPTSAAVPAELVAILGPGRPRLAESILWRRLAALPEDDAHRGAALAIATSLATLYEASLPDRARAAAMRRLARHERRLLERPAPP